jgi:hypothetical protein
MRLCARANAVERLGLADGLPRAPTGIRSEVRRFFEPPRQLCEIVRLPREM